MSARRPRTMSGCVAILPKDGHSCRRFDDDRPRRAYAMSALITHEMRVMVVVAHPDDEVIGYSAHLARWPRSTVLVHATDGAPPDDRDAHAAGFDSGEAYARARRAELGQALSHLPAQPAALLQLGQTDQRLVQRLPAVVHALE